MTAALSINRTASAEEVAGFFDFAICAIDMQIMTLYIGMGGTDDRFARTPLVRSVKLFNSPILNGVDRSDRLIVSHEPDDHKKDISEGQFGAEHMNDDTTRGL